MVLPFLLPTDARLRSCTEKTPYNCCSIKARPRVSVRVPSSSVPSLDLLHFLLLLLLCPQALQCTHLEQALEKCPLVLHLSHMAFHARHFSCLVLIVFGPWEGCWQAQQVAGELLLFAGVACVLRTAPVDSKLTVPCSCFACSLRAIKSVTSANVLSVLVSPRRSARISLSSMPLISWSRIISSL